MPNPDIPEEAVEDAVLCDGGGWLTMQPSTNRRECPGCVACQRPADAPMCVAVIHNELHCFRLSPAEWCRNCQELSRRG